MEKNILITKIQEGLSQRQIAEALATSQSNVRYWLRKLKLKTKTEKNSHTHCVLCSNETHRGRRWCSGCCTKIRRVRSKQAAIEYKGGKCIRCSFDGHPSALEFHHPNDDKAFAIGMVANKSWKVIKAELDKCELLCSNCHRAEHSTQTDEKVLIEAARYKGKTLAL